MVAVEQIKDAILKAKIPMKLDTWQMIYHEQQDDVRMAVWELYDEGLQTFAVDWTIIPEGSNA